MVNQGYTAAYVMQHNEMDLPARFPPIATVRIEKVFPA
jgi:hypothetical protein